MRPPFSHNCPVWLLRVHIPAEWSARLPKDSTKKIGMRKVIGASVNSVVVGLSKDFTKMILIAFVLAVPVAWYVMEK